MKTSTKAVLALVGALVIAGAIYGAYQYPSPQPIASAPNPGSTFISSKVAEMNFASATDTVYAVLNTDTNDRIISSQSFYGANSVATTSQYIEKCATSTVATGFNGNTNFISNQLLTQIGTTTGVSGMFFASTSPGISGVAASAASTTVRIWASGSYLVCKLVNNVAGANSLNTFDTTTTGFNAFNYYAQ